MGYRVEVSLRADAQLLNWMPQSAQVSSERFSGWPKTRQEWCIVVSSACLKILLACANSALATGESSIGSITQNKLFASIAFNIAPKFIESFETLKRRAKRTADGIPPTPHCRASASLAIPWSRSPRSAFLEPKVCFGKLPKLTG